MPRCPGSSFPTRHHGTGHFDNSQLGRRHHQRQLSLTNAYSRIVTSIWAEARLVNAAPAVTLLALILIAPASAAGIYKCTGANGNTTYADTPCAPDAQAVRVDPSTPSQTPSPANSPLAPWQAQINESIEKMATQCETSEYNNWRRFQKPKATPEEDIAKLKEIKQKCRANLPFPHAPPIGSASVTPHEMRTAQFPQAAVANQTQQSSTALPPIPVVQDSHAKACVPHSTSNLTSAVQGQQTTSLAMKSENGNLAAQVAPAPNAPAPFTPTTLTPEFLAAARDHSARETSASLCSTNAFNEWIKAQWDPLESTCRHASLSIL